MIAHCHPFIPHSLLNQVYHTDLIISKSSMPVERGDNFNILIFRSQKFDIYMFSKLAYHDHKAYMLLTKDSHPNLHTPHVS